MRDPMRTIVDYAHDGHEWILSMVAVLAGAALVLLLLGATALAQVPGEPADVPAEADALAGAAAIAMIGAIVRGLRELFPAQLAPVPSTLRSKRLVVLACGLLGLGFAVSGYVPLIGSGVMAYLVTAYSLGSAAYTSAGITSPKLRADTVGRLGRVHRDATLPPAPEA